MIVKDIAIKIPREEVYRLLKYDKKSTRVDERTEKLIDHLIDEGRKLAEPQGIYRDYFVRNITDHAVVLEGAGYDLLGASTVHRFWNAKKVTLLVVTIGTKLEKRIRELTEQVSLSNAAILDAVGSVMVESAVGYINELADQRAREAGFRTTKRFSPGYGDWPLKEQKGLLNLLQASRIGVSLTSSLLMQPQKSVSAALGWIK